MSDLGRKIKGQPRHLELICSQCHIRFNISCENNDFGSIVFKKSTFQKLPHLHTNALGSKFGFDVK